MSTNTVVGGAALALACLLSISSNALAAPCGPTVTRSIVVPCALAASPNVEAQRMAVAAARGDYDEARVFLPSNPVLSGTAGVPVSGPERFLVWSAALSQELEIGGQRGARMRAARAAMDAERARFTVSEADVAAAALSAYFDAIAARERVLLATRLAKVAGALATSARERAAEGLVSAVDADVAWAASVALVRERAAAEGRVAAANAVLSTLLGVDPTRGAVEVVGSLDPLPLTPDVAALADRAAATRPEIAAARAEADAERAQASALRRARIPNVTVSAFAQTDTINEVVLGGGVAVPIPLPSPLGRTNAGAIAAAEARARRADAQAEVLRREVQRDVATAVAELVARRRELEAFDAARVQSAARDLDALAEELAAGRLPVRDALVSQQALVQLLEAQLEARRALCIASVELARAAGLLPERGR